MCAFSHGGKKMSDNEKQNVIVLQDDQDKKVKKWTLDKYAKGIKKGKWWVIGSTVLVGVVGALALELGLNRNREYLSAQYVYNLATKVGDDNVERYLDGHVFDANAGLNINVLNEIKNSDEDFKKIDVEKIVKDGDISITKEAVYDKDENDKIIASTKSISYSISAKTRHFPSNAIGRKFVERIIEYPRTLSTNAINNYDVTNYITSGTNVEYTKQVAGLVKQYAEITKAYKDLGDKFGSSALAKSDGETIAQVSSDFVSKYASGAGTTVDVLSGSLYALHYVNYTEGKEAEKIEELHRTSKSYVEVLERKEEELAYQKDVLKSLTDITNINFEEKEDKLLEKVLETNLLIQELSEDVSGLKKELNLNGYYLKSGEWEFDSTKESTISCLSAKEEKWVKCCKDFASQLADVTKDIKKDLTTATDASRYIYSNCQNNISILGSGTVDVKNNIPWFVGALVGALLGFCISTFVCTALVIYKKED